MSSEPELAAKAAHKDAVAQNDSIKTDQLETLSPDALLALILLSLNEDAAEDVVNIPLAGKSEVADYMVVASGRSSRHVGALAEKMADRIKTASGMLCRSEGKDMGDWVLVDCGDVIVHIFRPEVRDFYDLEKLWSVNPREKS
ncbi:MAG: ribosome silencing factor [Rhodobacteraceae bacterium]|nr:ribosome silencing factor [Paracoccaceae bacterium]